MQAEVILKEPLPWVPPPQPLRGGGTRRGEEAAPPRTPLQWHCNFSIRVTRILTLEQCEFIFKKTFRIFLQVSFQKRKIINDLGRSVFIFA